VLLAGRDAAIGVKDCDAHAGLAVESRRDGTAGVARGGAEDVEPLAAPLEPASDQAGQAAARLEAAAQDIETRLEALKKLDAGPDPARVAMAEDELANAAAIVRKEAEAVRAGLADWPVPTVLVTEERDKYDAFAASRAAITKSGTVTLELALAGLPMVVTYRVSPTSAFLARRLITVDYVSLVNLLLQRPLVPELLQEDCTPERIAAETTALLDDEAAHAAQCRGLAEVIEGLGGLSPVPSQRAAEAVLEEIARRRAAA